MRVIFVLLVLIAGLPAMFAQTKTAPFTIGESVTFTSKVLDEKRTINVYLPLSYSDSIAKNYPVIYLLDGSKDEDFIHISGLVQFGSFSWINMLPESIVIGISNVDRKRDFTFPTTIKRDKKDFPTTGGSEHFINFLETELQPMVAARYRTTETRTIIGQSLGGLLATEIYIKKPNLFDNYVIVSPSLWWDDESLLKVQPTPAMKPKRVFVGVGEEGKGMVTGARLVYSHISEIAPQESTVSFSYYEELNHGDTLHLAVYDAFKMIFSSEKSVKR